MGVRENVSKNVDKVKKNLNSWLQRDLTVFSYQKQKVRQKACPDSYTGPYTGDF